MSTIKLLRKEKGLTQTQLAEMLHITQTSVSQWESGKTFPDTKQALALAEIFETSTDNILGRTKKIEASAKTEASIQDVIELYDKAPPALRKAALAVLRSAVQEKATQDD